MNEADLANSLLGAHGDVRLVYVHEQSDTLDVVAVVRDGGSLAEVRRALDAMLAEIKPAGRRVRLNAVHNPRGPYR